MMMIRHMIPHAHVASPGTPEEWRAWHRLRLLYREDRDLWTGRELAHLRFLRWLIETGRLAEDGCTAVVGASPLSA